MDEMSQAERFLQQQIKIQRDYFRQLAEVGSRIVIEDSDAGWFVFLGEIRRRRQMRRYLRSRFGFDARRWRFRLPSTVVTLYDCECFYSAALIYRVSDTIIRNVQWVLLDLLKEGSTFEVAEWIAYQSITETLRQLPAALGLNQMAVGTENRRGSPVYRSGFLSLSGWTAAHLSLQNSRLRDALITDSDYPATELLRRIPAAVELAVAKWNEALQKGRDRVPSKILSKVAHEIESDQLMRDEEGPLEDFEDFETLAHPDAAPLENFVAREEAQALLSRLMDEAGLSPRERDVWLLSVVEGYKQKEIAKMLNITTSTAGVLKSRADAKIRKLNRQAS